MSGFGKFVVNVLGIALGLVLFDIAKHFWGWPGVVALIATSAAVYFAADAALERMDR